MSSMRLTSIVVDCPVAPWSMRVAIDVHFGRMTVSNRSHASRKSHTASGYGGRRGGSPLPDPVVNGRVACDFRFGDLHDPVVVVAEPREPIRPLALTHLEVEVLVRWSKAPFC